MKQFGKKLGKLSLKILEHIVGTALGDEFVDELRAPTDRELAIEAALEKSEGMFAKKFSDKAFAEKMFTHLSDQNLGHISDAIEKFYDHPTDPDIENVLNQIIKRSFPEIDAEHIASAVKLYIKILIEELMLVDDRFRENVRGLSDLQMLDTLRNVEALLSQNNRNKRPPAGNRLPFLPNKAFINRKTEIDLLENILLAENTHPLMSRIAMITGMRGVGKTQLAVQFCYRNVDKFDGIHWIDASQPIESEIAACGQEMRLPNLPDETSERVAYTLSIWRAEPNRLVILDNIDDPQLIREWLPKLNGLKILITSHHVNWGADLELDVKELDTLQRPYSISLLQKLATEHPLMPIEELSTVADYLGDLPLALDLAGRYLNEKPNLSPLEYLDRLNKTATNPLHHTSLVNWVNNDQSPTLHPTSIVTTFLLSWEQLDETTDVLAQTLFISCGYLAPNVPIPHDIFYNIARQLINNSRETDEYVEDITDKAISQLQRLGLLRRAQPSYSLIHPLLARFAQTRVEDFYNLNILTQSILLLSGDALESRLPSKLGNLRQHMEALTKFAKNMELGSASALWNTLGEYYLFVAEYARAKDAFREVVKSTEKNSEQRADSINNFGKVLLKLGEFDGARGCFTQAHSIWIDKFGSDQPGSTEFLCNLGNAQKEAGDFETARQSIERALNIDRKYFSLVIGYEERYIPHKFVSRDLNSLGEILRLQGELQDARQLLEEALIIDETLENDLDIARDLNNLGKILRQIGNLNTARTSFERAREIYEKLLNKEHPDVAYCLWNIGRVLQDENEKERARDFYNRAVTIYQRVFPLGHPYIQELNDSIESL